MSPTAEGLPSIMDLELGQRQASDPNRREGLLGAGRMAGQLHDTVLLTRARAQTNAACSAASARWIRNG